MSLIKTINNIDPKFNVDELAGTVTAIFPYNGKKYIGVAKIHPEDQDYFSSYVGCTIALSRAKRKLLKAELDKVKKELQIKEQMYKEVSNYGRISEEITDPNGAFYMNLLRCRERETMLKRAYQKEKADLALYLKMQDETIKSFKRLKDKALKGQN